MSFWIILSWVFVLALTAINVVIFLKLKQANEGMMKSMFPNAKNMNEAMAGMQQMMSGFGGMQGMGGMGGMPGAGGKGGARNGFGGARTPTLPAGGGNADAQLKAAMELLNKMKK